jgi:D-alanyl-D-alanine dipeptidase
MAGEDLFQNQRAPWLTVDKTAAASITTPPNTGDVRLFIDSADDSLKYKDDAGSVFPLGASSNNFSATTNPTSSNDNSEGYSVGSLWVDVTNDEAYVALDVSSGAAIWGHVSVEVPPAASVTIADAGGIITATEVEGALQEIQTALDVEEAATAAHAADADAHLHASAHSDGGTDEVTVENLATAATNTTYALKPDGLGGVAFGAVSTVGGLDDLSDVDTDKSKTPADGDVLTYDGTDWNAEAAAAGGSGYAPDPSAQPDGKHLEVASGAYTFVDDPAGGTASTAGMPSDKSQKTDGAISGITSTTFADTDSATDLTIAAAAGDVLLIGASGRWVNGSGSEYGFLDAVTLVSSSPVNYVSGAGSTGEGVQAWSSLEDAKESFGGAIMYTVVAGDLESGNVTLRMRHRAGAATNITLQASTTQPLDFWVVNLKPAVTGAAALPSASASRTSGNLTLNNTSWTNVDTGLDLTVAAEAGDVVTLDLSAMVGGEAVNLYMTAATIVSAAVVNRITDGAFPHHGWGVRYPKLGGVHDVRACCWRVPVHRSVWRHRRRQCHVPLAVPDRHCCQQDALCEQQYRTRVVRHQPQGACDRRWGLCPDRDR